MEKKSKSGAGELQMFELENKKVFITGSWGFLGKHLFENLVDEPCSILFPPRQELNLCSESQTEKYFHNNKPEVVVHLAALVGGIKANQDRPYDFCFDNLVMGMNIIKYSIEHKVQKLLIVGTVCSYPANCLTPFKESDLWNGYPEPTNAPYGIAKKTLLILLQAARKQYGLNGIYLIPTNLYGPGDNFDLETSHVIPALIRKLYEAKKDNKSEVELWGTGQVTREFLYVEDCVQGIIQALKLYDEPEPLNFGSGEEVSIADLAIMIKEIIGYQGQLYYDWHKPDGQIRRQVDWSKAKEVIKFEPKIKLKEGLRKTINWFVENCDNVCK